MRHLLLTFGIFISCRFLAGQTGDCGCQGPVADDVRLSDKLTCVVLPAIDVIIPVDEIYAQWIFGKIYLNNGEIISGELIHYDGVSDQLMIGLKEPFARLAVDKHTILGFDMGSLNSNQILRFRRIKINQETDSRDVFLQLLVSGKNTLYVQRRLVRNIDPTKVTRLYMYFIIKEDGSLVSFTMPSAHTLIKLFPEKSDLYRISLRKERIHIRNEDQLIHSVELFNSL